MSILPRRERKTINKGLSKIILCHKEIRARRAVKQEGERQNEWGIVGNVTIYID